MKFYTYWVNPKNSSAPVYVKMCVKTWEKHIPVEDIVVINESNVLDYIGDDIDIGSFRQLSLPQQSDVVSVAVLSKLGGVFIDADTIVTGEVKSLIESRKRDVLYAFGNPLANNIHLAVMWCLEPGNSVLTQWYNTICEKMKVLPAARGWDYVGNSIIGELLKKESLAEEFEIIDRTLSGNIMESGYYPDESSQRAYLQFWFGDNVIAPDEIISRAKCNFISLHNSWTPPVYKKMQLESVVQVKITLSNLLCHLLAE